MKLSQIILLLAGEMYRNGDTEIHSIAVNYDFNDLYVEDGEIIFHQMLF